MYTVEHFKKMAENLADQIVVHMHTKRQLNVQLFLLEVAESRPIIDLIDN